MNLLFQERHRFLVFWKRLWFLFDLSFLKNSLCRTLISKFLHSYCWDPNFFLTKLRQEGLINYRYWELCKFHLGFCWSHLLNLDCQESSLRCCSLVPRECALDETTALFSDLATPQYHSHPSSLHWFEYGYLTMMNIYSVAINAHFKAF